MNREKALNELWDIIDECNKIRHPFQNIYPMWKGKPLNVILQQIYDALKEES